MDVQIISTIYTKNTRKTTRRASLTYSKCLSFQSHLTNNYSTHHTHFNGLDCPSPPQIYISPLFSLVRSISTWKKKTAAIANQQFASAAFYLLILLLLAFFTTKICSRLSKAKFDFWIFCVVFVLFFVFQNMQWNSEYFKATITITNVCALASTVHELSVTRAVYVDHSNSLFIVLFFRLVYTCSHLT